MYFFHTFEKLKLTFKFIISFVDEIKNLCKQKLSCYYSYLYIFVKHTNKTQYQSSLTTATQLEVP